MALQYCSFNSCLSKGVSHSVSLNAQAVHGFSMLFSKQMTPYHSATLLHPNFSALPYKYGLTSLTESSRHQNNLS